MNCADSTILGLTLLFIGLKLGHVIDWSWWWVLSPIWIGIIIAVLSLVYIKLFLLED